MVNQVQLHTRLAQEGLVAYCHERNMVVTAFCPLSGSDLGDTVVRARALPD
jgi:diketogulonate reductase-like aldo/keto reductase